MHVEPYLLQLAEFVIPESAIVEVIRSKWPSATAVYLFGSFAKGEQRADSDVDIAVLAFPTLDDKDSLRMDLEEILRRDVDLIDLRKANTILQKEVVYEGRRIWTSSEYDSDIYELFIIASYQKLNEQRRGIIEAGLADGRFYKP